jgi:hypothetical protein
MSVTQCCLSGTRLCALSRGVRVIRTVTAAEKHPADFDPMTHNHASAVAAAGSQRVNGTLEAIKHMGLAAHDHFKCFVVLVPASFTLSHGDSPSDDR